MAKKRRRKKTNYVGEATGTLAGTFVGIHVTYPLVAAAPPIASGADNAYGCSCTGCQRCYKKFERTRIRK